MSEYRLLPSDYRLYKFLFDLIKFSFVGGGIIKSLGFWAFSFALTNGVASQILRPDVSLSHE